VLHTLLDLVMMLLDFFEKLNPRRQPKWWSLTFLHPIKHWLIEVSANLSSYPFFLSPSLTTLALSLFSIAIFMVAHRSMQPTASVCHL
jgi:hypothetical protein